MNDFSKYFFLLILFLLFPGKTFSQINNIDSLMQVASTARSDSTKVNILNTLSENLMQIGEISKSISISNEALKLSEKINFEKGIAFSYNNLGLIERMKGNYLESLEFHNKALKLYEKINENEGVAQSHNYIGSVNALQSNYPDAFNQFSIAMEIAEKLNYKKELAHAYNNIGNVHLAQGNYSIALENYFSSLRISKEINDKKGISLYNGNIGIVYWRQGDYAEALKYFKTSLNYAESINDKQLIISANSKIGVIYYMKDGDYENALKSFKTSLKLSDESGDRKGAANAYNNIAHVYGMSGNFSEAIKNLNKALQISESIGNKEGIINAQIGLGQVKIELKKYNEANLHLQQALKLSEKIGYKEGEKGSLSNLSMLYSKLENYKEAFQYFKMYSDIKDSILNEQTNNQISLLTVQFESEKKDKEIEILNNENIIKEAEIERQKLIKYIAFFFVAFIILIALLLIYNIRIKHKARQITESNEIRQRISRDLHDEIGAGLTSITMLCEKGKKEKKEQGVLFDKISTRSQNVSEKLSEVVWATNPENDNLQSLVSFIRNYVSKFFEDSTLLHTLNLPYKIPEIKLKPNVSRNLFFVLKEAINNSVKHSHATKIDVSLAIKKDKSFILKVIDNGVGIDYDALPQHRSGFTNMNRRIEEINAKFELISELNKGVTVKITGSFE